MTIDIARLIAKLEGKQTEVVLRTDYSTRFLDRFWAKVEIRSPEGCWVWQGGRNTRGYGMVYTRSPASELAHRLSYQLAYGEVASGQYICHKCDFPPCVNPKHLFEGTPKDNSDDMMAKGRGRNGYIPERSVAEMIEQLSKYGHL